MIIYIIGTLYTDMYRNTFTGVMYFEYKQIIVYKILQLSFFLQNNMFKKFFQVRYVCV